MSKTGYALGQLNPIVYFEDSRGVIALPPSTAAALQLRDRMRQRGFELREAGTLGEVDALQSRMQRQEYAQQQASIERDERQGNRIDSSIRERLKARMISSSTTPYEREFIENYLKLREEKRDKYKNRFTADQVYFEAREFDANTKHLQDAADRVPNQKDVECTRCRKYQRVKGSNLCMRCANG